MASLNQNLKILTTLISVRVETKRKQNQLKCETGSTSHVKTKDGITTLQQNVRNEVTFAYF